MLGHGGSSAGSYLADPTSPIPSHCAVIILLKSVPVNQLSRLELKQYSFIFQLTKILSAGLWSVDPWSFSMSAHDTFLHENKQINRHKCVLGAIQMIECSTTEYLYACFWVFSSVFIYIFGPRGLLLDLQK